MTTTIDGSAGITTNAGGSVNPSTTIDGINYSCRAWVNFNGTGTVAIRGSGNVSSITDNGTGDYTVNFTTALSDANYSVVFGIVGYATNDVRNGIVIYGTLTGGATTKTTSALRINTGSTSTTAAFDVADNNVAIFR